MEVVFLELGGNQGNKRELLSQARLEIGKRVGVISQKSSIYETPPWGFESNDNFYNQVIVVETQLEPVDLLNELLQIEKQLGRIRGKEQFISRTMDIDVLFFGSRRISDSFLQIPHPRMHLRRFVLEPMVEIAPDLMHPEFQQTMKQLLEQCSDNSVCYRLPFKE